MSFRELVNEKRAESTDRKNYGQCDAEPHIAAPRAVVERMLLTSFRRQYDSSVVDFSIRSLSTDLREELGLAPRHLVE